MTIKGDIRKQYNFNYNCVYHMGNITNNAQYEYDLSQIISKPEDGDELYNIKLFGIFTVLNDYFYLYIIKLCKILKFYLF